MNKPQTLVEVQRRDGHGATVVAARFRYIADALRFVRQHADEGPWQIHTSDGNRGGQPAPAASLRRRKEGVPASQRSTAITRPAMPRVNGSA